MVSVIFAHEGLNFILVNSCALHCFSYKQ